MALVADRDHRRRLAKATNPSGASGRGAGLAFAFLGTLLLLDSLRILRFDWWELWPLVLIVLGGVMVWGAVTRGQTTRAHSLDSKSEVHAVAVLGSSVRGSNSQDFRGGEATAVFGSCEIDLRQASIGTHEAVFDTMAVWAGIEIKVPPDWTVIVQAAPVLGEHRGQDDAAGGFEQAPPVLRGLAFMGSVSHELVADRRFANPIPCRARTGCGARPENRSAESGDPISTKTGITGIATTSQASRRARTSRRSDSRARPS